MAWSLIAAAFRRWWLARNLVPIIVFVSTAVLALGLDRRVVGSGNSCGGDGRSYSRRRWRWHERIATTFGFSLASLVRTVSPVALIVFLSALPLPLP
jgi:hypothetical protein